VIARSAILPSVDFNASVGVTRQGAGKTSSSRANRSPKARVSTAPATQDSPSGSSSSTVASGEQHVRANLGLEATQAQVDEQRLQITYLVEQRFYELVRAQRQLQSSAMPRSGAATRQITRCGCSRAAGPPRPTFTPRAQTGTTTRCSGSARNAPSSWRAPTLDRHRLDPGAPLTVVEPPNMLAEPNQPPAVQDAVERALTKRPSLKGFALTAESNRKAASAAKGNYWPTLSVNGFWDRRTRDDMVLLFKAPGRDAQAGVTLDLNWNIFAGLSQRRTCARQRSR